MINPGLTLRTIDLYPIENCQFIDIHYHANPDLYNRRWNALEAGALYQSFNGALVLRSHLGSTSAQATLAQSLGFPVLPSVTLNHLAGGIHYRVVMQALSQYQSLNPTRMVVDFPSITGRTIKSRLSRDLTHNYLKDYSLISKTVFNRQALIGKHVIDILKMASDYPIVLSTGHASQAEIYQLIDACIQYNVPALLLNQPANPLTGLNAAALTPLLHHDFIWVEQTALTYLIGHQDKEDLSTVLTSLPRVLYSSDLGQTSQMDVEDWLIFSNNLFAELKLTEQRKADLWRNNAIALLT